MYSRKRNVRSKKKWTAIFVFVFLIAVYLDLQYKGLFYRMLPPKVQSYIDEVTIT